MTRYALVIGIQKYSGLGFQNLEKSAEDAEAVAQLLRPDDDWEVTRLPSQWDSQENQARVAETPLKRAELVKKIKEFFKQAENSDALIYFSGHGYEYIDDFEERRSYLVPSDCTVNDVTAKGISLQSLYKQIEKANFSSLVVLLDCCHSGGLFSESSKLPRFDDQNRTYLLAAACRDYAKAYEGKVYSVFTEAIIECLSSPGRVRASDLQLHIRKKLQASGQEPVILSSPIGDITLVTNKTELEGLSQSSISFQTVLLQLRAEKKYDYLDQSFFEVFEAEAARAARNHARTEVLHLTAAKWSMLFQGNYVERDQQGEALQQAQQLAQKPGISLMVIRGEPGAGKTALLRWLAHELSRQGKRVLHKKGSDQVGWLEELRAVSEAIGNEHFYVIIDDLFRDETILEELEQAEPLFPLTLIATTRPNEDRHTELNGTQIKTDCLDLNKPSHTEKERILALPEVWSHLADKSNAEREALLDSPIMLVLMLQLSEGKPFDIVLWDIVKSLPNSNNRPIYQAFGVLCSFFQYGVIVPFEILRLCLPVGNWSEQLILTELEGLVETATYGGYEGLFPVHELIAKTVMELDYKPRGHHNQPYAWLQPPLLIEQNLRKVIPALDANKETQQRWLRISFRVLLSTDLADLVNQVLREYHPEILIIQSQSSIPNLFYWARIYKLVDWIEEQDRCTNDLMIRQPQESYDWNFWFAQISKLGSHNQKQTVISAAQVWLEKHPEDADVRARYLAFLSWWGTPEQKQDAITITQTWLEDHSEDIHVRAKYLACLSEWGTPEQNQDAISTTQSWLEDHSEDIHVRTRYLACLSEWGTPEQNQDAIFTTQTWLEDHPEDTIVRTKYLACLSEWGTPEQNQDAIFTTQTWLEDHPEDTIVCTKYLACLSKWGTPEQNQDAIFTTQTWLEDHPEDTNIRTQFLAFLSQWGTPKQKEAAIATTQIWLNHHPEDTSIRTQLLVFLSQLGTPKQKEAAITTTQIWLNHHPEDTNVRTQLLAFLSQWGTPEQKEAAIATTQIWLNHHPNDTYIRTQFLAFIRKQGCDVENIADLIVQQWQWITTQILVPKGLWLTFLPVLYLHASPKLYKPAIALAVRHYPNGSWLNSLLFAYFYDYVDHATCYSLAIYISQSRLPYDKWHKYIYAANYFRDLGDFEMAEQLYQRTLSAARNLMHEIPSMADIIDLGSLSYAQLLLLIDPPQPDQAIGKADSVLKKTPKHGYGHLLMAQAYQSKGVSFYIKAKNHFEKAIKFDECPNGYIYCQFGCFYRYAIGNIVKARDCFEKSIAREVNLPAFIELAELNMAEGNLERASYLLEQGLTLPLLKRTEREMRDQLSDRIVALKQQLE